MHSPKEKEADRMIRKIPPETSTFHFHNENPKGRRTGDCVIRAIARATGDS